MPYPGQLREMEVDHVVDEATGQANIRAASGRGGRERAREGRKRKRQEDETETASATETAEETSAKKVDIGPLRNIASHRLCVQCTHER